MHLIEVDNIFNPDDFTEFPFQNETDPIQNVTLFNYKEFPILLQLVQNVVQSIITNNLNLGFSEQDLLDRVEVQGQTYTGDVFVLHYDSYNEEIRALEPYGQRIITGLVYLNDDFEGGLTVFPKVDKTVVPKKAKMALFTNVHDDLTLDEESIHRATEVQNGNKSILNVWFREKPVVVKLTEN